MSAIVTDAKLEAALNYLAETDDASAEAKADVERQTIRCKRARARCFLLGDGSVENKKAQAEVSADVVTADEDYISAVITHEKLKASRERADIVIRVYQTLSANQRKS